MSTLAGFDIGGTKCAVVLGRLAGEGVELIGKRSFPTPAPPDAAMQQLMDTLEEMLREHAVEDLGAIGISCGGPLDSRRGLVLSPPNLPGWVNMDVVTPTRERFGVPASLQNDANAGALAEWLWGAGRGFDNIIFLTMGTGMGAGLILNGQLYAGTSDMGGEVGHIRLSEDGPVGFGKAGSFEGWCSGGGIARLAQAKAEAALAEGRPPLYCPSLEDLPNVTAESVAAAAHEGDILALEVWETVAHYLGRGLATLVDVLNPQRVIIGSIYGRQRDLLEPVAMRVLQEEAIPYSLEVCEVVPAGLGERIGDLASLSIALHTLNRKR
ncbi:MAG TPA: ROK family protein [Ardenticatenaceae bacterium]|jgi:glucokinase